ncbi:hypothetical protein AYM40_25360 [Paraburkholderia phytofirmans OLGA172]|uniref:Uncharacterized protein n=2 Tax=Paraburkholderia phytofirmans TaxID=261302 RepID=A0A160FRN4_9BURK|nr:hypothetical protein AYM40_25360 [Paraburkholderia phytofirmans OLGA172]
MRNLNSNALEITARHGNQPTRTDSATLRIGLRLWGFVESEVSMWIPGLPTLGGLLAWEIAQQRDGEGAGMIIHLVKSSSNALGSFCWNCLGANEAIRASANAARVEVALFSGDVRRLPAVRSGLWAMAGTRPVETALHTLAHAVTIPQLMHDRACQKVWCGSRGAAARRSNGCRDLTIKLAQPSLYGLDFGQRIGTDS